MFLGDSNEQSNCLLSWSSPSFLRKEDTHRHVRHPAGSSDVEETLSRVRGMGRVGPGYGEVGFLGGMVRGLLSDKQTFEQRPREGKSSGFWKKSVPG